MLYLSIYTSFGGHELGFEPVALPQQLINSKARQDLDRSQVTQPGEKAGSFPSSARPWADTEVTQTVRELGLRCKAAPGYLGRMVS